MGGAEWWLKSDAGLIARIAIGATIFIAMAIVDLIQHGRDATRWREYLFLLVAVAMAMAYGAINDFIASSISWEYWYFGKGLDQRLGTRIPPDQAALQWEACKVGLKATWSAGLIIGVALLIANNPRRNLPRLSYRKLFELLPMILLGSAVGAALGAWAGHAGWLTWISHDLLMLWHDNLFRPARFNCVYGMNLGGYVGGIVATIIAIVQVMRRRAAGPTHRG
jgi:hypothetical protein